MKRARFSAFLSELTFALPLLALASAAFGQSTALAPHDKILRAYVNNAGIWTYCISGILQFPEGSDADVLNVRLLVKSLYEGHEFLFRLG